MNNVKFVNTITECTKTDSIENKLKKCHTNTGNIVWHERCKKGIKYNSIIDISEVSKYGSSDVLVIPVSNNINCTETEFSKKLYLLERTKAQITLIGLGVQPPNNSITPKEFIKLLPKRKLRLLQNIAEKGTSIGVRGEYTADCLEKIGIYNVRIIGCPSFYSNSIKKRTFIMPKAKLNKICINITGGLPNEKRILELVVKSGIESKVIRQGLNDNINIIMKNVENKNKFLFRDNINKSLANNSDIKTFWENNNEIFWNLTDWENYLYNEKFTFSLGTRLHGNMISYLMGIPSLLIVHDIRTFEIAKSLKIPYITKKKLNQIRYIEQLQEKCVYEKKFYDNYLKMRAKYLEFLEENKINHEFV